MTIQEAVNACPHCGSQKLKATEVGYSAVYYPMSFERLQAIQCLRCRWSGQPTNLETEAIRTRPGP